MTKRVFVFLTVLTAALLLLAGGMVLRPCGHVRIVLVNNWAAMEVDIEDVSVEVHDGKKSEHKTGIWSGTPVFMVPLKLRLPIDGDVAYHVTARNLKTGEVRSGEFGYDTFPSGMVNLFLFDDEGIHYAHWHIRPLLKDLTLTGADMMSCADGR